MNVATAIEKRYKESREKYLNKEITKDEWFHICLEYLEKVVIKG